MNRRKSNLSVAIAYANLFASRELIVFTWFGFLAVLVLLATAPAASAEPPQVEFDVSYMINCRDVTPEEFALLNPDEKLVEAKFQVSSLVHRGDEEDLVQYLYRIESPTNRLTVVDYLPRTTLSTDVVGHVGVQRQREKNRSIGIGISGQYAQLAQSEASGSSASKSSSSVSYELLPPMELVAASGTTRRGAGAYFKMKPSPRTSLEGAKDFGLVLRVDRQWRGDCVIVHCEASRLVRGIVPMIPTRKSVCGRADFVVALYAEGDQEAKQAAKQLVDAELRLREVAASRHDEIRKRSYPKFRHQVGRKLRLVESRIHPSWLQQVITDSDRSDQLPESVRRMADAYVEAKGRLQSLAVGL